MKKVIYGLICMNILLGSLLTKQVFAATISKEIQDLVGYVQSMIFTDNGTPDGNIKVRISGADGGIYASGGIWIGKGSGNGIYSNGINVGIGTTDLSNRLDVGGNIKLQDGFALKVGNGSSYIQGNGLNMSIVGGGDIGIDGYINLAKTSSWMPYTNGYNYIRGGTMAYGSTWYDESDNNYYIDPNVGTKLNGLYADSIGIGTTTPGYKLDISDSGTTAMIRIGQNSATRRYIGTRLDRNGNVEKWFMGMDDSSDNLIVRRGGSTNDIVLTTVGNIGFGVSYPTKRLEASGLINATEGLCIAGQCIRSWNELSSLLTPPCTVSSWSPDASSVCAGTSFVQTSNCSTTRTAVGNKYCAPTCSSGYSWNSSYSACTKPVIQPLNCDFSNSTIDGWYKGKGRCGDPGGLVMRLNELTNKGATVAKNDFDAAYAGDMVRQGFCATCYTAYHNRALCGTDGSTYITNTTLCRQ